MQDHVTDYLDLWSLQTTHLLAQTATNCVWRVRRGPKEVEHEGKLLVLKHFNATGQQVEAQSTRALRVFDALGAVTLFAAMQDAPLMKYYAGGSANGLPDSAAAMALCTLAGKLRGRSPQDMPLFVFCCAMLRGFDVPLIRRAQTVALDLAASTENAVFRHGDLNYDYILQSLSGWRAIVSQPVADDAAYEFANIFGNPLGRDDLILDPARAVRLATGFARKI